MTALGVLMQLAGTVGVACAGAVAIAALTRGSDAGLPVFFFAILCGIRSMFHAAAGTSLVYARGERARRDISRYLGISLAQSLVVLLFLDQQHAIDTAGLVALGGVLLLWPAVIAIVFAQARIDHVLEGGLPTPGDFGFESMSLLMAFFGACGTAVGVAVLVELANSPPELLVSPVGACFVFVACAMIIRSMVHGVSGMRGIGGAGYYTANDNAGRYYKHGLASTAAIAAGILTCAALIGSPLTAIVIGFGAGTVLWVWPSIVCRYYREQNFTVFISGDEPVFVRPPDGGVTTWGWLLISAGALGVVVGLGAVVSGDIIGLGHHSPWWLVAAAGTQLWAGTEMVRMTSRVRIAGSVCGALTIATAIYVGWPIASELAQLDTGAVTAAVSRVARTSYVAFGLILGLGSMIVPKRVPATAATALYWNHAGRLNRG